MWRYLSARSHARNGLSKILAVFGAAHRRSFWVSGLANGHAAATAVAFNPPVRIDIQLLALAFSRLALNKIKLNYSNLIFLIFLSKPAKKSACISLRARIKRGSFCRRQLRNSIYNLR